MDEARVRVDQATDYRHLLRGELAVRCQRNPRYSQRAFARDLELRPHRLSEVLNGKQGLSGEWAERIAIRLGYSAREKEVFCDLVKSEHSRSPAEKVAAQLRVKARQLDPEYRQIQEDAFRVIADWYHLAILELTKVRGFRGEIAWIARTLAIDTEAATAAVDRLVRLGFMRRDAGTMRISAGDTYTPGGIPSESIKSFHEQVMHKAIRALYIQPLDSREYSAAMLSLNRARLPEAKARIRKFWAELDKFLNQDEEKTDLYCLALQFFSLSPLEH